MPKQIYLSPVADDIVLPAQTPFSVEYIESKPVKEVIQTLTATIFLQWLHNYTKSCGREVDEQEAIIGFTLYVKNTFGGDTVEMMLEQIETMVKVESLNQ